MKTRNELKLSDYAFCAMLALAFAAAPYYIQNGTCRVTVAYILTSFVYFAAFLVLDDIARLGFKHYIHRTRELKLASVFDKLMQKRCAVLYIAVLILLCWLPVLLALYPGTLINDTWGQLEQYLRLLDGERPLTDHHPVFSTLYMGGVIVTFQKLTGNWRFAIFIYTMLQAVLTSLAFSCSVSYAYKKLKIGSSAAICMLAIYCFLPIYPTSVQTVSKDALSAWLFVFFVLMYIEGVRTGGEVFHSAKFIIGITAVALLCALTKKVNTYVVLLALAAMFIFVRKRRWWLLIPIGIVSGVMFLLMPKLFDYYEIKPGGKQEMFSLPFQQTARYVKEHPDDITEEEYAAIDKLLGMSDLAARYNPLAADPVKGYTERGETEDYIRYLKAWLRQGLRHPKTYLHAFNAMVSGWFSSYEYDPLMNMGWHSQLNPNYVPEDLWTRKGVFDKTAASYQELYHNLYKNPLLTFMFTYGFYAVIIPAFAFSTAIRRWNKRWNRYWIALLPMLLSLVLGCFLAPVSIHFEGRRYLYPLTYTMPIMLAWCIYIYKDNMTKKEDVIQKENLHE